MKAGACSLPVSLMFNHKSVFNVMTSSLMGFNRSWKVFPVLINGTKLVLPQNQTSGNLDLSWHPWRFLMMA